MAKGFKFEDNSKKVKQQIQRATEAGMESALLMIEGAAKAKAPVDDGELRDKLDHNVTKKGNQMIGKMGSPLDYAPYVEFGTGEHAENGAGRKGGWSYQDEEGNWHYTKGQKPQPYLRPAFRENKKNVQDTLGKEYGTTFKGK